MKRQRREKETGGQLNKSGYRGIKRDRQTKKQGQKYEDRADIERLLKRDKDKYKGKKG